MQTLHKAFRAAFCPHIHTADSDQAKGWESITVKTTSAHKVSSPRQGTVPLHKYPWKAALLSVRALLTDLSREHSLMSETLPVSIHLCSSQADQCADLSNSSLCAFTFPLCPSYHQHTHTEHLGRGCCASVPWVQGWNSPCSWAGGDRSHAQVVCASLCLARESPRAKGVPDSVRKGLGRAL